MNFTKAMTDLFLSVKDWAQPAFDALSDRIDEREAAIRIDIKGQIDSLLLEMSEGIDKKFLSLVTPEKISKECLNDVRQYFDSKMDEIREKSLSIDCLQPAIDESVVKAIGSIPIPKDGAIGPKGEDGVSVSHEAVQAMIDEAVAKAMAGVEKPADGHPGRDALDIELQPGIDAEKSYQRGVFATHNGGIWRSYEQTHGMRGWECIARGYPDIRFEMRGERTLAVISVDSVGKEEVQTYSIPVMIYREVWKEGNIYQQGDMVSFGGSLWHCDASDVTDKPGVPGSRWTLCAKKGRDGKSS
jgi:hypothetical protein